MIKKVANDGRILLMIYACTFSFGASMFKAIEQVDWIDAYYWASTTMTTAGYGDVTAKTELGKIFSILFQQWSIVIVLALTIAWVLGKVNPDIFTDGEQKKIEVKLDSIERKLDAKEHD